MSLRVDETAVAMAIARGDLSLAVILRESAAATAGNETYWLFELNEAGQDIARSYTNHPAICVLGVGLTRLTAECKDAMTLKGT